MRADRDRKKRRKNGDSILLKEAAKIAEKTMDAVMLQLMDEIEKAWIRNGGTVSE